MALTDYRKVPNERRVGDAWHGTWPDTLLKDDSPKWRPANGLSVRRRHRVQPRGGCLRV
ncbi:hypothetical protein [Xanthomonas populi]|uniref:hypothetical protein n=1 Tax=Xanthomonas populi TaxID=53414 RepID=UPI003CCDF3E6